MSTSSDKTHALCPTTSAATSRYDRQERVVPRHHTVPAGMFGLGRAPNPPYLPPLWSQCIHPEGNVYFVRNSRPSVVTEANMYVQAVQDQIAQSLDDMQTFLAAHDIYLSDTVELTLDPSDDMAYCRYYFIDHASRVEFWVDPVTTETLGLRTSVSEAHLRHALEEHYWTHVEHFPSHQVTGLDLLVDDMFDVFLNARADHLTSTVSTVPFTAAECASYIEILKTAREAGRLQSTHMRWTVARLWSLLCNHRFMTHYSQEQCRLSRDQSILELHNPRTPRTFSLFSVLSCGTAQGYKLALEKLWVDEIIYLMDWRPFFASCQQDWTAAVSMSFALLLCNIVSFLAPFSIQPFTMLSILLCNAAILSGATLLMQHQGAQAMTATEAASYLTSAQNPDSGFAHKAILFSLPRTLLLWAFGIFSAQGAAWFVLWICAQRYGCVFLAALVVLIVGLRAVKVARSLWRKWSCSRTVDEEAQNEV